MTTILAGMFLGLMFGGLYGAVLGGFLGAWINKSRLELNTSHTQYSGFNRQRVQSVFFDATFLVMGRMAKADGRVSEDEIKTASSIMNGMRLSTVQRRAAIELFNRGKELNVDIEVPLQSLLQVRSSSTLIPVFLEIQLQAAYADGSLTQAERAVFRQICGLLNVSSIGFELLHKRFLAQKTFYERGYHTHFRQPDSINELRHAYDVLGVEKTATDAEIKKAYRKLMNQHHPDKLVAKGLPEEMMQVAKQKTQEIRGAYDKIKEHRKKR
ncbi:MAG: co-chaperone DjlA [Candidatus Endonucleobacter bathymodioli]|uniref:Co-chaperone DjlA n=1 Tax=Candidatus Endonucleibacter bathymodioli TaxID=539814 RepID=A0AA90SSG7_9GAMM|nr:co-chaperone DjlA [Candidatus Endonucleobacter bathymodioli]